MVTEPRLPIPTTLIKGVRNDTVALTTPPGFPGRLAVDGDHGRFGGQSRSSRMRWARLSARCCPEDGSKAVAQARTASRAAASPIARYATISGRLSSRMAIGIRMKAVARTNSTAPDPSSVR